MPKKSISALDLTAIVSELQFLLHSKVSRLYHDEGRELLLDLHVTGKGKKFLKIIPGKWLCLTANKNEFVKQSNLSQQLRKYLEGAYLQSITQKDAERIVILEFEQKDHFYFLIVELFSKGNIILTTREYGIIALLEKQNWKDRAVAVGEKYIFPAPVVNWKKITEKELLEVVKRSEKRNLATALAIELGVGGLYAEEICKIAGVDKDKLPSQLGAKEIKELHHSLRGLIASLNTPQGYIYLEQITPFPLQGEEPLTVTPTYNEAMDILNPFQLLSPYDKKIKSLSSIIAGQEESIHKLDEAVKAATRKAELIYEKYTPLQRLLQIVKDLRKTSDWKEIAQELKKEKKIKLIDLKNKKVTLDL